MSANIYGICNQKGGVGKTTLTFHLARAAARAERRTLVVDADPQGSLTGIISQDVLPEDQAGLADALSDRTSETLTDVLVPTVWNNVDLVPTVGSALGSVRDEITAVPVGREKRLSNALAQVRESYDLVLIDCAPSLDQLTINALTAADGAIIITHAKKLSLDGLGQLLGTISLVREHYNPGITVRGVIVNQFEAGTISARAWLAALVESAEVHGLPLLDPPVPKRVVIADAAEAASGLDEWGTAEASMLAKQFDEYLVEIERTTR